MGFSHALIFTLLTVTTFFTNAIVDQQHFHSLPYRGPTHAPSPAPSHHGHHPGGGGHHRHPHSQSSSTYPSPPPTQPPVKPPAYPSPPPTKPPTQPPVSPPAKPPTRPPPTPYMGKMVAVQGVVYLKSCNYTGIDTLSGSSPLSGAMVELRCKNTKYMLKQNATTDKNGYFFLQTQAEQITKFAARQCRAYLAQKPNSGPYTPTNLNGGVSGSFLHLDKLAPLKPLPFTLFTVGPFAYNPPKCYKTLG